MLNKVRQVTFYPLKGCSSSSVVFQLDRKPLIYSPILLYLLPSSMHIINIGTKQETRTPFKYNVLIFKIQYRKGVLVTCFSSIDYLQTGNQQIMQKIVNSFSVLQRTGDVPGLTHHNSLSPRSYQAARQLLKTHLYMFPENLMLLFHPGCSTELGI